MYISHVHFAFCVMLCCCNDICCLSKIYLCSHHIMCCYLQESILRTSVLDEMHSCVNGLFMRDGTGGGGGGVLHSRTDLCYHIRCKDCIYYLYLMR